ncbi:hypothetical protein [Bradyrhizobium sp. NAS96.2]|uniref:hypothetical protein n=1 Tax=Bradyrhizobium sp. NAS96.2 TaxID=1680160 RepID=UPI00093AB52F|nr:hypothetical protein [Bradyrhizobium sp. NAS96.2]
MLELFFLPPMAIGRLGSSDAPLASFSWAEANTRHDANETIITPALSLRVEPDDSVAPYLPDEIDFKDELGRIRPVAPFFELWAKMQSREGGTVDVPVTLDLLKHLGATPHNVSYEITLANHKAARRAADSACAFSARVMVAGDNHRRQELLAFSPHTAGQEPLVRPERPIPLGTFQVIRPVPNKDEGRGVDRSILRVRFTPPAGLVYGPPTAVNGPAPQVMPGVYEAAGIQFGRVHEIVPPERRILNPATMWSRYIMMNGHFEDPQPQDGYDGAAVGNFQSWGCVDDTSDGLIVATLAVHGRRFRAAARVFSSPPDFAPDRRPFFSIGDDIADRELPPLPTVDAETFKVSKEEIVDLFHRAFETASLFNLDAIRTRALQENRVRLGKHVGPPGRDEPRAGGESMTAEDTPYVDRLPTLAPQAPSRFSGAGSELPLPYTAVITHVHAALKDEAVLIDFLRRRADAVERVIRPPFGRLHEIPVEPNAEADPHFRDPRVFRDQLHDMRMPPYMRDANLQPLSLSWRQYHLLIGVIAYLRSTAPPECSQTSAINSGARR